MFKKIFLLAFLGGAIISLVNCGGSDSQSSSGSSSSTLNNFTLSGRIFASENTATDSDNNDENAKKVSNNSTQTAQSIPNPTILGGYVNNPGTGPAGPSRQAGDENDFFSVELRAGQIINLFIANENLSGNDLDLALLDRNGFVLNASVGDGKTESLTVPNNGHYFIQVQAFSGHSTYVLSIGQNTSSMALGMRLQDDFAVGESIIKFKESAGFTAQSAKESLGMETNSQDSSRRMLFQLDKNALQALSLEEDKKFADQKLREKYETLMEIKRLRQRDDIEEASPNYIMKAFRMPNDTLHRYQWDHTLMNLPQAWNTTTGSSSIVVAVIDTGVLLRHPDLKGKLVSGYDFIANRSVALDGNGLDSNPDDPGDQSQGGSSFHGTHIAGTIGALTNNNEGVAGVGWNTRIMPLRVLGRGGEGRDYDIEQAIRFAAGLSNDSNTRPSKTADIINLSLGGPVISDGFRDVIRQVRNKGIFIVAAAGNDDSNTPIFPASLDGVISVSAVNIYKEKASYSNFGRYVDVTAPGGDNTPDINGDGLPDGVINTIGDDKRGFIEFTFASSIGTSMASPQVAGVIALMKAANPNLTPENVDDLLRNGKMTQDLGVRGRDDYYGYGLIDANKSVLAAAELSGGRTTTSSAQLVVNPESLNFGSNRSNITISVENAGSGNLQVINIAEDSRGFLSISPTQNVNSNGIGNYVVNVDRSLLNTGTFTATITITTNVNTVQIPIILQVGNFTVGGDAGHQYILLVDPETLDTVQETRATTVNGVYNYAFRGVKNGTYIIAAGNDLDNDGYICDIGEACGAYLTIDRPTYFSVTSDRTQLDFNSGYNISFFSQSIGEEISPPSQGYARIRSKERAVSW